MSIRIVGVRLILSFLVFCGLGSIPLQAQVIDNTSPANHFDYIPDFTYDEIADRIQCIEKDIPLHFNDRVKSFIDYFTIRDRAYTRGILERVDLFFPIFEAYLAKHNLPDELKYLAIVESGLNPAAISRAGAGGLWQFMPSTGRMFGLQKDWYVDDRMDPFAATEAACLYLKDLYRQFDDWELALAAYNTGPGNVRRAIRRSGYKKSFWDIYNYLPRETRSYVPQFVAIAYTVNYAESHNLFVAPEVPIKTDTIHVSQYTHLETLASQVNICLDEILVLNPQIQRGAIPEDYKNFVLKIPYEVKTKILADRAAIFDSASRVGKEELAYLARNLPGSTYGRERHTYRVRSGDVLGSIAANYHVRVEDIKQWNNLRSNLIRVGQRLHIWVLPTYSSETADQYIVKGLPQNKNTQELGSGQYHRVQWGDTLWSISRRYSNVSIDEIKKLNNLSGNTIKPGQLLRLSSQ